MDGKGKVPANRDSSDPDQEQPTDDEQHDQGPQPEQGGGGGNKEAAPSPPAPPSSTEAADQSAPQAQLHPSSRKTNAEAMDVKEAEAETKSKQEVLPATSQNPGSQQLGNRQSKTLVVGQDVDRRKQYLQSLDNDIEVQLSLFRNVLRCELPQKGFSAEELNAIEVLNSLKIQKEEGRARNEDVNRVGWENEMPTIDLVRLLGEGSRRHRRPRTAELGFVLLTMKMLTRWVGKMKGPRFILLVCLVKVVGDTEELPELGFVLLTIKMLTRRVGEMKGLFVCLVELVGDTERPRTARTRVRLPGLRWGNRTARTGTDAGDATGDNLVGSRWRNILRSRNRRPMEKHKAQNYKK